MVNKGGIGVGSASIVLVFAVLCLTVFSLITLVVASNDKALVDAEVRLVVGYYEADALAERVLADLLIAEKLPSSLHGVEINTMWNEELGIETVYFYCHISEIKVLHVHLAFFEDTFRVLSWRMSSIDDWEYNPGLNVWIGD
ncbi:MAG: hypothetical protein FWC20_01445 [Oscillospiraceae bacterium]|nr:hypothetical protein [Oscillospiraceae bacterium]MCL2278057.1 hypothetical protein [Oscillospiraceae bacterium]